MTNRKEFADRRQPINDLQSRLEEYREPIRQKWKINFGRGTSLFFFNQLNNHMQIIDPKSTDDGTPHSLDEAITQSIEYTTTCVGSLLQCYRYFTTGQLKDQPTDDCTISMASTFLDFFNLDNPDTVEALCCELHIPVRQVNRSLHNLITFIPSRR